MTKYALLASILVLAGCVTNPEKPPPPPPAATSAGGITTIETFSSAKRTPNSDDPQDTQTQRADDAVNAETAKIDAWIDDACPRLLGPASWSLCVRHQRNAVNAGLPSTKGLPADIRAWIEDTCPRLLGPASWSLCVQHQLQAVDAGLPNTGRSSAETAHTGPANARGENTIRRVETTPPTPGGTMATVDPEPKAPSRPPEDPAPHLPNPKNGERWLCVDAWHGLWAAVLSSIEDGKDLPLELTIVLTRETPRDQAKGTGKIAVAGVIHKTEFEIEGVKPALGLDLRGPREHLAGHNRHRQRRIGGVLRLPGTGAAGNLDQSERAPTLRGRVTLPQHSGAKRTPIATKTEWVVESQTQGMSKRVSDAQDMRLGQENRQYAGH